MKEGESLNEHLKLMKELTDQLGAIGAVIEERPDCNTLGQFATKLVVSLGSFATKTVSCSDNEVTMNTDERETSADEVTVDQAAKEQQNQRASKKIRIL